MHQPYDLKNLQTIELHLLLEHLRLGPVHLKKHLAPLQYKELLSWGTISQEEVSWLESDKAEKIGNSILVINTIITSVFGAWMGLSGCIGCSLGALNILIPVLLLALFLSGVIGYSSFKFTKKQARTAIENQKIHNLELEVMKILNQKLDCKIEALHQYLNTSLFLLENDKEKVEMSSDDQDKFKTAFQAFDWLKQLKRVLKHRLEQFHDNKIYEIYMAELIKILRTIGKILIKHIRLAEMLNISKMPKSELNRNKNFIYKIPFIDILTNPKLAVPKTSIKSVFWWQDNVLGLMLGLAPSILGGFASMFVFVGGGPNVIRELGLTQLADFLIQPFSRFVEVLAALLVTGYFAFSYLYSSRKLSQRRHFLENTEKEITNEETGTLERNHQLTMLINIKVQIQKIISIFTILKQLDRYLKEKPYMTELSKLESQEEDNRFIHFPP
jgi:hypothetical protein